VANYCKDSTIYLYISINYYTVSTGIMLEHVWKLSKKTKHKFPCWIELVLCELKKVEVPHRMEHKH